MVLENKSRLNWTKFGDDNTKFFQARVSHRRRINRIESLFNSEKWWTYNLDEIKDIFLNRFEKVFKSNLFDFSVPNFPSIALGINSQDTDDLLKEVTVEDIKFILQKNRSE